MKHIAFIGAGNMGGALVRGACKALDPQEVLIYEPSQKAAAALSAETGCRWRLAALRRCGKRGM